MAILNDNNQRAPSNLPSTIQVYQNIVFGEPDYLLQNQITFQVTGVCEAKSPWNIGHSEIDDVISVKLAETISVANVIGHASPTNACWPAVQQLYDYMCWNSFASGIFNFQFSIYSIIVTCGHSPWRTTTYFIIPFLLY